MHTLARGRWLPVIITLLMAVPSSAQVTGRPLAVKHALSPGETHTIEVVAPDAGGLISGAVRWDAGCTVDPSENAAGCRALTVEFVDDAGVAVRQPHHIWLSGGAPSARAERIGFVTAAAGRFAIRVTAAPKATAGTFALDLTTRTVEDRKVAPAVVTAQEYRSERIEQLTREVASGQSGAEEAFWRDVRTRGTPLIEPAPDSTDSVLATFVWEARYDIRNVLVRWPPGYIEPNGYYMAPLPNTRVWHKTVRVWKGTRLQYQLAPNDTPEDRDMVSVRDPLNPRVADLGDGHSSLLELPGAPDESYVRQQGSPSGRVEPLAFASRGAASQWDVWVYTPAGYKDDGSYPLVVLLPGYLYRQGLQAPRIVDNLVAAGKIRPPVICFVQPPPVVRSDIRAVARVIATELVPLVRTSYRVSSDPGDTVVGGFSAGGVWAAFIALHHPEVFGNVLSQSGAFRGPWDPGTVEYPNFPQRAYAVSARQRIRFYLNAGLYENFPRSDVPAHERSLMPGLTLSNRHFRDVLIAKGYDVVYREVAGAHDNTHPIRRNPKEDIEPLYVRWPVWRTRGPDSRAPSGVGRRLAPTVRSVAAQSR